MKQDKYQGPTEELDREFSKHITHFQVQRDLRNSGKFVEIT